MADVARAAGVSAMTVSRALRDGPPVGAETRARIRAAAEGLGYQLDLTASGLRSRRTGFVAVTVPSINNANFAETLRGLTEGFRAAGLQVLLGATGYDPEEEERLVGALLRRRPEAFVLTGGDHAGATRAMLARAGLPVVETWDRPEAPLGAVVGFSNEAAGALMAAHLMARGHRRLAFIGGEDARDPRGAGRRRGFVAAVLAAGLDPPRLLPAGPPPVAMDEGAAGMRALLADPEGVTAAMCVSDLAAFGALGECQRRGVAVPGAMAIGGFGDYDIARACVPALTTIDVGARGIGARAAEAALALIGGAAPPEAAVAAIAPRLVARATT